MSLFFTKVVSLLTTSPGNLVYHLVLVFSIAGALQGAVHHWRASGFPQSRRVVVGLTILLGLQLSLFAVSGVAWLGFLDPTWVLPPLDRAVSLLSLVWIAWLWAFPEAVRLTDAASLLLSFLGLALFGLTYIFNVQGAVTGFNLSLFETIWQIMTLGMVGLGLLAILLRRPNGWGNGLAMLVLALLGHLTALLFPHEGNYPGLLRITQLAMYPLLLMLPQRFLTPVAQKQRKVIQVDGKAEPTVRRERRRYSTDPKTFQSMVTLAAESSPEKICQDLTRSISHAMLADLCFLFSVNNNSLSITCGYDLIREESLEGAFVDKENIPLIANAILRGRPLRLPSSSTSLDLKGLGKILGLNSAGHLLSVPIVSPEGGPLGSILILSPYSNRLWSTDDQNYLANVAPMFASLLERAEKMASLKEESALARQEAQTAQQDVIDVKQRSEEKNTELEALRQKFAQSQSQIENMSALLLAQAETQHLIEQIQAENEQLRASPGISREAVAQMESELRHALQEAARMQNALAEANARIMALEENSGSPISNEQANVIASISQELRQPMSSIIGYTDLLLGESVGILGTLQRKFLERIKASIERIGGLIDDLIQITNLETGNMEFKPEPVDLNLIIDNAMAYTGTQIREKNITLRLDIPGKIPQVQTDRDALQQILIHLLQNAAVASLSEGTINLRVQTQVEEGKDYLFLQVTDSGGGIPPEDISRVFMRRYRAEHSLIQGVGDTGVGLSIAKALVEAQNGRIWVETEANVGSTMSVLLPVELEEE